MTRFIMTSAKMGAPTKYTVELADKICKLIATHPYGLPTIIKMYDLPDRQCIYNWVNTHDDFFDKYMKAKEQQAHLLVDSLLEIPDEIPIYEDKEGNDRIDSGMLGRAKLKSENLRWSASILAPRHYRDRDKNEANNNDLHKDIVKRKHDLDEKNKKTY
jgi:hypothetical protein